MTAQDRPCAACNAQPGEPCDPFCIGLAARDDTAGCSCTPDPDTGEMYDADGFPCAHRA